MKPVLFMLCLKVYIKLCTSTTLVFLFRKKTLTQHRSAAAVITHVDSPETFFLCRYTCAHMHVHVRTHACTHAHTCTCTLTHPHTYAFLHTHTLAHTCTHACMHTLWHPNQSNGNIVMENTLTVNSTFNFGGNLKNI